MTIRHGRDSLVPRQVHTSVVFLLGVLAGVTAAVAGVVLVVGFWGGA